MITMIRIIALSFFIAVASTLQGDDVLQDVFGQAADSNNFSNEMNCSNIDGVGSGCYQCYVCSDPEVERHKKKGKTKTEFQLHDSKCAKTDVCCFAQSQLSFRSNSDCGKSNPEGYPRKVRPELKSVLPGEYPWRAWIHSKSDTQKPLCAAVYISQEAHALITSAYCVQQYPAESLFVRFSDDTFTYDVTRVLIHRHFRKETRYYDIAVIRLSSMLSLPSWVKPVCWSETKSQFATSCVAVSKENYYVNTVIPLQTKCVEGKIPLDESFICTVAARNDYEPEFGGGLICPEEAVNSIYYTAYGITLYRSGDTSIMIHTNVSYFHGWIQEQINILINN